MVSDNSHTLDAIYNRVLVVDDSQAILDLLNAHLQQLKGLSVDTATTYAKSKVLLDSQGDSPFLCAILDLNLPDAPDGEVVALVQEYGIPSIILTASIDMAVQRTMKAKLIVDYVIKRDITEIEYVTKQVKHIYENQYTKILAVDDSSTYREYLAVLIGNLRYQVLLANDGRHALEVLDKNPDITLMIVDYHMPNMNGLELIEQVRRQYKKQELAILGLSNETDKELIVKLLKTGANDFMTKPIVLDEFYCRVNHNVNTIGYVRQINQSARMDFLTQTYNRMSLFDLGELLYANSQRDCDVLAVAMIDADHFKRINDSYGHQMGDNVLIELAKTFKDTMRQSDMVARFGGEEFVCVVSIKDKEDAMTLFEKVRKAVEEICIPYGNNTITITVSIGVTMQQGHTFSDMINKADEAVYQAKRQGRNQVVLI